MESFIKYSKKPYSDTLRKVEKYISVIESKRFNNKNNIKNISICPCDYKKDNSFPSLSSFVPFTNGTYWGDKRDYHAWFHFEIDVANDFTYLHLCSDQTGVSTCNPQFMVYINGQLKQGMDTNHLDLLLDPGKNDIYVYGYIALHLISTKLFVFTHELNKDVNGLYYDLKYPFASLSYLKENSKQYIHILKELENAIDLVYLSDLNSEKFYDSVKIARKYLLNNLLNDKNEPLSKTICIGHTHIDSAWLWQFKQTREKVQRSFSTVLKLMDEYPEYKFMGSQPLQYKFLKEENPELYEKIKEKVKEGRWEVEGSMWVESDCNLPSGESLIRQIMLGKEFFSKEFNKDNHILWLPDVFGYPASLPQILRKSDIDFFVTSKISWNDTNKIPYDTFNWKGIDGTSISTYFLTGQNADRKEPCDLATYVGETNADWIYGTYERYQQKELNNEVLLAFGWGDGGGGPTREQLELLQRGKCALTHNHNAEIGFVSDFCSRLKEKMLKKEFPIWNGELYFEYHRGTYTTMADNKKNNRKAEFLYHNAEQLEVITNVIFNKNASYLALNKGWELILNNQFHDIIPGSSIREVYEDSDNDYKEIFKIGNEVVNDECSLIAANIAKEEGYVIFNNTSFIASGIVKLNNKTVLVNDVPANGYKVTKSFVDTNNVEIFDKTVRTKIFNVVFDEKFNIVSLFDKRTDRELIPENKVGNEFRLYIDYPDDFDAWDFKYYSRNKYEVIGNVTSQEVVNDGVRKGIKITRKFLHSNIEQYIWFYDELEQIDFETKVKWHDQHKMLKVAFPYDINAANATYDIQFGSIQRPTHFNTSWDKAKYEVCAHKYADVSDAGFGVALINDCKYGHDIHNNVMQLSLLRGSTEPNEIADQGTHEFKYSLLIHNSNYVDSNVIKSSYLFNNPLILKEATGSSTLVPVSYSLVSSDKENVVIETIKPSADRNGYIVRLYESKNMNCNVTLTFGFAIKDAFETNLLEKNPKNLEFAENRINLTLKGFEIKTLKITNKGVIYEKKN